MIEKLEECISLSKQQNEYIKVIKEGIESLKEHYRIACEYNEIADKKIEELNNIINKLEEELRNDYTIWMCGARQNGKSVKFGIDVCKTHFYNRLQELRGSDKD